MKKFLATTLIGTSALGFTTEKEEAQEKSYYHCITPKAFFRYHEEENYNYKIYGGGIEYSLFKPEGINLDISVITNGKSSEVLIESEHTLKYHFPIGERDVLYPLMASRTSSHKIHGEENKNVFIHKTTTFLGLGWEIKPDDTLRIRIEGSLFQDLDNALVIQENDEFWGQSYSNPFGWKGKMTFLSNPIKKNLFWELEAYWAQTFKKCYQESGLTIGFKWGF